MSLSDATIADHVLALYEYRDSPRVNFTYVETPKNDVGIRWGLARLGGFDLIVLRGTSSIRDTLKDLIAVPTCHEIPGLGHVHAGFYNGMQEAWSVLRTVIRQPVIISGHSLGGAHASIVTGLMILDGKPPVRRVTFGEPRAGFTKLRDVLAAVPATMYHNRYDPVSDLPLHIPPVFPYVDAGTRTELAVTAHGFALLWGPLSPHHMFLYREGLK